MIIRVICLDKYQCLLSKILRYVRHLVKCVFFERRYSERVNICNEKMEEREVMGCQLNTHSFKSNTIIRMPKMKSISRSSLKVDTELT